MTRRFKLFTGPFIGLFLLVPILASTGCEGIQFTRLPRGDTVMLYSLARPDYIGEQSAIDFAASIPQLVVVERPKAQNYTDFDVAFSEVDGEAVWLPAGLFESFDISPGIAVDTTGSSFETLVEAPRSGYVTDVPVPLEVGPVYIVRSRQLQTCAKYAKVEVLELDAADGIVELRFLQSNLCNDRDLSEIEEDDG